MRQVYVPAVCGTRIRATIAVVAVVVVVVYPSVLQTDSAGQSPGPVPEMANIEGMQTTRIQGYILCKILCW